jgi:hypothetical protein
MALPNRSPWISLLPLLFTAAVAHAAAEKTAEPALEDRRVEGADAKFLVDVLIGSGAKQEPAPDDLPGDHPRMKIAKDFVYRMEAITCRKGKETKCDPLALSPEKAKALVAMLKKLGVKETKPPKSAGKNTQPYSYLKEVMCGAVTAPAEPACTITAHFHPRR